MPAVEEPAAPAGSTPIKTETELEVDVKEPVAGEKQPPSSAGVAVPTSDDSLDADIVVVASPSDSLSRAEEEVEADEAATEPVDAVIEPTANAVVEDEAPVVSDDTAAPASGELAGGSCLPVGYVANFPVLVGCFDGMNCSRCVCFRATSPTLFDGYK